MYRIATQVSTQQYQKCRHSVYLILQFGFLAAIRRFTSILNLAEGVFWMASLKPPSIDWINNLFLPDCVSHCCCLEFRVIWAKFHRMCLPLSLPYTMFFFHILQSMPFQNYVVLAFSLTSSTNKYTCLECIYFSKNHWFN